jgi:hypothetical protein
VLIVGDEVAKILQGGGTGSATSDAKLRQAGDILSAADSPKSIAAALKEISTLIGYRRTALTRGTYMESKAGPPTAAATAPTIGERRMINGQLGEWDGKGWKAVK